MRISVFGLGYVGCVTAACLARDGHDVIGCDTAAEKVALVAAGKSPLIEPGLDELIAAGRASGRLSVTTSAAAAVAASDVALLCVGTPTGAGGRPNLGALGRVGRAIGAALRGRDTPYTVVVRSTVPPGTTEGMLHRSLLLGAAGPIPVRLAVNPELTREGCAVKDFDHPPYNLVGSDDPAAIAVVREIYAKIDAPVIETSVRVAEMLKCVSNTFHALKICFANEIAALCASRQVDADEVMRIFRLDKKLNVGEAYLRPGFAYGGSCLPKDVRCLVHLGSSTHVPLPLLAAIGPSNQVQIERGHAAILAAGKKRIGFIGLAFKPGTDDVRESPYLALAEDLVQRGHDVKVFDPAISPATLVGANREYLGEHITDIDGLFAASVDDLAAHAELLVIAHPGADATRAIELLRPGCAIVDLEHGARSVKPAARAQMVNRPWRRGRSVALIAGLFAGLACMPAKAGEHRLAAGSDLQAALDAAQPGDTLVLAAGATWSGNFVLPAKPDDGASEPAWITIRGEHAGVAGTRITAADSGQLPRLEGAGGPVLSTAPGANHYRLEDLEIRPRPGVFLTNLVELGTTDPVDEVPHDLEILRCYLHGDPSVGGRRGIALNSAKTRIADSVISDFKEKGADSQAIAAWAGPGPFVIEDNYLEAAGENLLFGGGDPPDASRIPSDIVVRGNHLAKPLAWKGAGWSVKNLFELKDARRVTVEGNLFEHDWADAQNGYAILFTVRNQDGTAPFSTVEDVTFTGNVVRGAGAGVNILGRDDSHADQSGRTSRIVIRDNLFYDIGGPQWGGPGTLFQLLRGTKDVVIEHNTAFQVGNLIMAEGEPHQAFVFRDNAVACNEYGIIGTGTATGLPTLATYFPHADVRGNLLAGGSAGSYPPGNYYATTLDRVVNLDREHGAATWIGDRKMVTSDGRPPGADPRLVAAAAAARRE